MKRKKYIWRVRYKCEGASFTEWHSTEKQLQEALDILNALATKYTVTKYELKEVQDD